MVFFRKNKEEKTTNSSNYKSLFLLKFSAMKKALFYLLIGTSISFLLSYFLLGSHGWKLDLYHGIAFGVAWGIAFFIDNKKTSLLQKFLISFSVMGVLVVAGVFLFNFETAVLSVIKFSTVIVAYYLIASMRSSKSLRE